MLARIFTTFWAIGSPLPYFRLFQGLNPLIDAVFVLFDDAH